MGRTVLAVLVITCPIGGCDYHGRTIADGTAAGVTDGGIDGGGDGIATCGKPGAIIDDFADGVPAYYWRVTTVYYNDVVETGGELVLTPGGSGPIGYTASAAVDLRDAGVEVEVPTMLAAGTGATASFYAGNRGLELGIAQHDGVLSGFIDRATGGRAGNTVPYDPVMHRWWRIVDSGGRVSIMTSPDGAAWSSLLDATGAAFTASVQIALEAEGYGAGSVAFRNLRATERGVAVGAAPWCKAATFVDHFDGDTIDYAWAASANPAGGCDPKFGGGKLHIDQLGEVCTGQVVSMSLYDLSASAVVLDVDPIASVPYGFGVSLAITDPAQSRAAISATNSSLCAVVNDYDYQCPEGYGGQRYWRLRDDAGTLVWDASPDQVDWTPLRSYAGLLDLTRVRITIGTYQSYQAQPRINFASPGLDP